MGLSSRPPIKIHPPRSPVSGHIRSFPTGVNKVDTCVEIGRTLIETYQKLKFGVERKNCSGFQILMQGIHDLRTIVPQISAKQLLKREGFLPSKWLSFPF